MYPDELHQVLAAVVGERHDVVVTETEDQMRPSSGSILKATSGSQSSSSQRPAPEIDDRSSCRCRPPGNPHTSDRMWRVGYQACPAWPKMRLLYQLDASVFLGRRRSHASFSPSSFTFFERPVLQRKVGHHFFQRRRLTTQILHRARSCRTRRARRCLSVPRNSLDPPCTLRRQYLGRLSSKDILVALQSFLDDSIFSSAGYSGVFGAECPLVLVLRALCPVRISVSSMLLAATMNQKSLTGETVNLL